MRKTRDDLSAQLVLALPFNSDASPVEVDEPLSLAAFILEWLWDAGYRIVEDDEEYGK
jgi:hypothetical protein